MSADGLGTYKDLLNSDASRDETALQRFFEANPSFLPGHHTVDTNSASDPWPCAVISQPSLPSLSTKIPDFMWISHDSVFLYPVLIEIETPWKKWFYADGRTQHSDLTKPISQAANWRSWFSKGYNQAAFYEYYRIPRHLQDRTLSPRYVIIHGRRAEASANPARVALRGSLSNLNDTRLLTFDHLEPDPRAFRYFTVSATDVGFKVHQNSPSVDWSSIPAYVKSEIIDADRFAADEPPPGYIFRPPGRN